MSARLELHGLGKSYGSTVALRGVDLALAPGMVLALLGENGAGKSTLVNCLAGVVEADAGCMRLDGHPWRPHSPLAARRAGVAMVHQELCLAPHLDVAENITLGLEPQRFGWLQRTRQRHLATEALARIGAPSIPLHLPVGRLPIAARQLVEIARCLIGQPRVLILDEPTSSLSSREAETLFTVVRQLASQGVSILYISHFIEECRQVADRYLVLRDGAAVQAGELAGVATADLITAMVGRTVDELYPRQPHGLGQPVLTTTNLAGTGAPTAFDLELRQGEILGIFGLLGSGRTEGLRTVFGLEPVATGLVAVEGRIDQGRSPRQRICQGLGLLSEDRAGEGLALDLSLAENLTLSALPRCVRGDGLLSLRRVEDLTRHLITRLGIRCSGPGQRMRELSGGNQQKVAVARLLAQDAAILLLDEPTRGIDVGAKAAIYSLISELAAAGRAVILVSSYLPELLGVCDTLAVMNRGRLGAKRAIGEWTPAALLAAALDEEPLA